MPVTCPVCVQRDPSGEVKTRVRVGEAGTKSMKPPPGRAENPPPGPPKPPLDATRGSVTGVQVDVASAGGGDGIAGVASGVGDGGGAGAPVTGTDHTWISWSAGLAVCGQSVSSTRSSSASSATESVGARANSAGRARLTKCTPSDETARVGAPLARSVPSTATNRDPEEMRQAAMGRRVVPEPSVAIDSRAASRTPRSTWSRKTPVAIAIGAAPGRRSDPR